MTESQAHLHEEPLNLVTAKRGEQAVTELASQQAIPPRLRTFAVKVLDPACPLHGPVFHSLFASSSTRPVIDDESSWPSDRTVEGYRKRRERDRSRPPTRAQTGPRLQDRSRSPVQHRRNHDTIQLNQSDSLCDLLTLVRFADINDKRKA